MFYYVTGQYAINVLAIEKILFAIARQVENTVCMYMYVTIEVMTQQQHSILFCFV